MNIIYLCVKKKGGILKICEESGSACMNEGVGLFDLEKQL